MHQLLWLIPVLPLAGFIALTIVGKAMPKKMVTWTAVLPTAVSCVIVMMVGTAFAVSPPADNAFSQRMGTWFEVSGFKVNFGLYLDSLSLVMAAVVSFVGLLILVYSVHFILKEEGYSRFFSYMNLFIAAMLILLLADNFLLLYLGWEGVGLCSYLLIGFWYKNPKNCLAAIKAFIVTRIGDTLFVIGLLMLFNKYHILQIQPIMNEIAHLSVGSSFCTMAALLLLGGAIGKSAQLPLQIWLPDAMAGPTPVSALIHAATMVTAGVYLIARTHVLFSMSPTVMKLVAVIGAATLLLAGFSAMVQKDIKRILAYSTISQIGYMFLALGAGAWAAAIYHLVTHAMFKASLFLGAGILIMTLNNEHNIFKMGGLRKIFPKTFWAFMAASLTLAAIPPLTMTFNSKDLILNTVWSTSSENRGLWLAGIFGSFLTAAYTFRLLYIVFFGEVKIKPSAKPTFVMLAPFCILAFLAAFSGFPEMFNTCFGIKSLYNFLQTSLPQPVVSIPLPAHGWIMQIFYILISLIGMASAYIIYRHSSKIIDFLMKTFITSNLYTFVQAGFGFDWLYQHLFVQPYIWLARINKNDCLDRITDLGVYTCRFSNKLLSKTVNGNLRWYIACVGIGAVILVGMMMLL